MPSNEEKKKAWERFTLICKPEQSGKTFIMIQKINNEIDLLPHGVKVVNVIFCENNLLLTKQTSNRLERTFFRNAKNNESLKDAKALGMLRITENMKAHINVVQHQYRRI